MPRALILAACICSLGGCSEYFARADAVSRTDGDAVASNMAKQMVDPWPREAADRNISYDGMVMRGAVDRYHKGRVIKPVPQNTSSVSSAQQEQSASTPPN